MSDNTIRDDLAALLGRTYWAAGEAPPMWPHLADAILREFLVVPRSDIVGTDYYVGANRLDPPATFTDRATAVSEAAWRGVEVRERPRLPWVPIRPGVPDVR